MVKERLLIMIQKYFYRRSSHKGGIVIEKITALRFHSATYNYVPHHNLVASHLSGIGENPSNILNSTASHKVASLSSDIAL